MKSDIKISAEAERLIERIKNKDICVGVIGLGYVGLPLAIEFASAGVPTIGFDTDERKIGALRNGENYIEDLNNDFVRKMIDDGKFYASGDMSEIAKCDAVFICVPTPFTETKDPDIRFVLDAATEVSDNMKNGTVIVLKSTTFPGTTEKYVMPIIDSKNNRRVGKDYYLAFSPERIDPGNKKWNTGNTPITLGGVTPECGEVAAAVLEIAIQKVVKVSTPAIAEMEKLLENIFRSVNIALVNEMARLCDRIGINIWEVVDAAATKPFGYMPFYPGPGIGGHCILIDPYYLAWMARKYDFVTDFITLAAETNEDMPFYVRDMVIKEIAKQPIVMSEAKVLVLGMAFKKNVNDLRHSPALKVFELLDAEGIHNVEYFDPYIPQVKIGEKEKKSIEGLNPQTIASYDVVLITTDHSVFDFAMIAENAKVVIDTRNACKNIEKRDNIVLLGDGK